MRWIVAAAVLSFSVPAFARPPREAAPPTVELSVTPVDGTEFAYRFHLKAVGNEDELVVDHRLLSFRIERTSGTRTHVVRCQHPAVPRRVDEERVIRRSQGTLEYVETIDLRMYCFGAKLDAAQSGARIVPEYGFVRASATAYIARRPEGGETPPRSRRRQAPRPTHLAHVEGPSFVRVPVPVSTSPDLPPIFAGVRPVDVASGGHVVFHPYVESRRDGVRVYLHDDQWVLRVRRPDGQERVCGMHFHAVVPVLDFFSKLRRGGRATSTLDAKRFCPEGTFDAPGIYEVVPDVSLPYDGSRFGFEAVTGNYRGRVGYVRVRPRAGAYVLFPTPRSER